MWVPEFRVLIRNSELCITSGIPDSYPMVSGIPNPEPKVSRIPNLDLRFPESYQKSGILVSLPVVVQHCGRLFFEWPSLLYVGLRFIYEEKLTSRLFGSGWCCVLLLLSKNMRFSFQYQIVWMSELHFRCNLYPVTVTSRIMVFTSAMQPLDKFQRYL